MNKKLLLIPILMGFLVGGSFVAHADESDSSSVQTAQKAPEKRAGQPESAVTSYSEQVQQSHAPHAVIDSNKATKSYSHGGGGSTGGGTSAGGTTSYGGSTYYGGNNSSYGSQSGSTGTEETSNDKRVNRSHQMTDTERRNATKKAKIGVARATINLQDANHKYSNLRNSENHKMVIKAKQALQEANNALTKIEL